MHAAGPDIHSGPEYHACSHGGNQLLAESICTFFQSAGMAYVALSRVKKLENLHLIALTEQAIKVSSKCLQEINRLRQTYRPDLPQYTIPREPQPQKRKRKQSGIVLLSPKRQKVDGKRKTDKPVAPPPPAKKKCPPRKVVSKPSPQPRNEKNGGGYRLRPRSIVTRCIVQS